MPLRSIVFLKLRFLWRDAMRRQKTEIAWGACLLSHGANFGPSLFLLGKWHKQSTLIYSIIKIFVIYFFFNAGPYECTSKRIFVVIPCDIVVCRLINEFFTVCLFFICPGWLFVGHFPMLNQYQWSGSAKQVSGHWHQGGHAHNPPQTHLFFAPWSDKKIRPATSAQGNTLLFSLHDFCRWCHHPTAQKETKRNRDAQSFWCKASLWSWERSEPTQVKMKSKVNVFQCKNQKRSYCRCFCFF